MQHTLVKFGIPALFAALVIAFGSLASAQVCTMDAMMCPDGTYVGRSGPNCEFVCPDGGGTVMPDPMHGYGKGGFPAGDTSYEGGPTDTVSVGVGGSIDYNYNSSGCGENGMLCPEFNGGNDGTVFVGYDGCGENGMLCPEFNDGIGEEGGTNWYDPCAYDNWIWINPCYPDQDISANGYSDVDGGGYIMPDPMHGYGKGGFPAGDTSYEGGPNDVTTVNADGSINTEASVGPDTSASFSSFWEGFLSFFGW